MPNAFQSLWQHQKPTFSEAPLAEIRRRADHAIAQDRKFRFVGLIAASLLVATFCLIYSGSQSTLGRMGGAVGIAAGVAMAYRAQRLMSTHPLLAGALGIDAWRRILDREHRALTICWQTMLLVQVGVVLNLIGDAKGSLALGVTILATVAPVVVVAFLTRRKAQAYRRRRDELDRL